MRIIHWFVGVTISECAKRLYNLGEKLQSIADKMIDIGIKHLQKSVDINKLTDFEKLEINKLKNKIEELEK